LLHAMSVRDLDGIVASSAPVPPALYFVEKFTASAFRAAFLTTL
jgi:hypothetical protein